MTRDLRMRWLTPALALLLAVGLSACNSFTPNTIFGAHSEFGHSVDVCPQKTLGNPRQLAGSCLAFAWISLMLAIAADMRSASRSFPRGVHVCKNK